jgi:hypothetical protein
LPFKIVLGIDAAVLPAAFTVIADVEVVRIAIVNRTANFETFMGNLQGSDLFPVCARGLVHRIGKTPTSSQEG